MLFRSDVSANGEFNQNEFDSTLQDLPEAFIDFNENGVFDGNLPAPTNPVDSNGGEDEWYVERSGAQDNGQYDSGDGIYNGLLCSDEALAANACTRETVNVRARSELVMSGSTPYIRAVTALNDCSLSVDNLRISLLLLIYIKTARFRKFHRLHGFVLSIYLQAALLLRS